MIVFGVRQEQHAKTKISPEKKAWKNSEFLGMTWSKMYRVVVFLFFSALKNTDSSSVVRLESCVLWSCRRSPLSPKMVFQWSHCDHGWHTHTQYMEPVGERAKHGGEEKEAEPVIRGDAVFHASCRKRPWLHVRTRSNRQSRGRHLSYHLEIVKMMPKWGCVWSYINFKAHSGFSTVEFGTACSCWYITSPLLGVDLEKKQLGI